MEDTVILIDNNNTHNGKQEGLTSHDREQQPELEPKHKITLENNKKYKNYDKYFVYSKYIESELSKKFGDIKNYFTVSDDKFVSMPIDKVEEKDGIKVVIKGIKIGIFNFETGDILFLSLPHSEIIVETLAFLDENKLIMIMETYDEKIFLSNGKLFIYDENLGSITKWDIRTSKFEAYFLFDNSFDVDNMKLSDNGVLLFVYGKKRWDWYKDPYLCISIYSTDNGNKFTTFIIDTVYLIASNIGARLLIVYHKYNETNFRFYICDPFAPYIPKKSYVEANDLFKDFDVESDNNFENKYIIKNDKIVGFNHDGKLVIKSLIPDNDNWISYLRDTLKDSNSIFISPVSEKIIDLIRRIIDKSKETTDEATTDIDKKMAKEAIKVIESEKTTEEATTDIDKSKETIEEITMDIVPELYISSDRDVKEFVNICDCLDNDDLVMVTYWGGLVWTFNTKDNKIELNYCWEDEASSYMSMIHHNPAFSQSQLPKDDRFLFNELIKKHINNKLFLILYGKKLIENIIKEDEDMLLRKLFNGCIKQIEKDEEILNTQIFKIFSQSITEISKKNPSFFEDFVIKISLLCVLKVEKKEQILKHLNHYQSYSSLSDELREFISDINSSDWKESTKPIITKITKLIKDEKQESEADKIQKIYETKKISKKY
ncbi:13705_t:CDS:2 [Gigaspora rosea]|nr:13705_t:CDS:2 [Gigaspora rosea]